MAAIIYSSEALTDLERIIEFLLEASPETAAATLTRIQAAVMILGSHPLIGCRVDAFRRELVISWGASGYLALYSFDAGLDLVRILRIRHQREAGYREYQ
jgi:plasmid stabilization system protein ParE